MRPFELGLILPMVENVPDGRPHRWDDIRNHATLAEDMGFDTVWISDELLWRTPDWRGPRGWWECVAMAGAVAASTSRIKVGTWVLSNPHRNPTLTAKIVDTLDEIAGGRFVFGFGTGASDGEITAFGFEQDHIYSRFEEALDIILPLLRDGRTTHKGTYYSAQDLELRPRGPSAGDIPILLGARGPKAMRLAAKHADIWSWPQNLAGLEALEPVLAELDAG